jgi:hypothetical protein
MLNLFRLDAAGSDHRPYLNDEGKFIWIPSFSFIASSSSKNQDCTTDDAPDIIPPLGVIWAIIPFGRTVSYFRLGVVSNYTSNIRLKSLFRSSSDDFTASISTSPR